MVDVGIVIPARGHWDYVESAVRSAAGTPDSLVVVVDDASERRPSPLTLVRWAHEEGGACVVIYLDQWGGLSRAWNFGIRVCMRAECTHIVCGNSDLVFARGWWSPIRDSLTRYNFAGPVTNAPGHHRAQDVARYLADYTLSDDEYDVDDTQRRLESLAVPDVGRSALNGFCVAARSDTWLTVEHPRGRAFDEAVPLAGNEDDLFARARTRGLTACVCPRSFVLHYRSVTRGLKGRPIERGALRRPGCGACGGENS